ncbi:DUF1236 domain-containing protein [Roseiarcus sp.]|uniref:DUF1236 domain-containing protein n=1 Tax=Roseiarcus sp. TaxID=1969460 RepID=UPI003F99EB67
MRRTWIGAAAAAGLTTVAAAGFAAAQEQPRQDQAPAGQQMERPQNHRGEPSQNGAMERGQSAQAQSPGEERQRSEHSGQDMKGQEKMGEQPRNAAGEEGKSAQGSQRPTEERANQAQTEKLNGEKRTGEESRTNTQGVQNDHQNSHENGAAATQGQANRTGQAETSREKSEGERTGQATGNESSAEEKGKTAAERQPANQAGQAQTGQTEMQSNRQGEIQNARRETHVDPKNVHAEGNAHLTNDKAARIADTLMANATPQNVNVNVNVGARLPGGVDLMPLPVTIIDLVPEYRDYDYVVVNDEIVIVQPSTRDVVEVINTGGGEAMNSGAQAMAATTRLNPCGTP